MAPEVLPLLAEPAARALRALSAPARRARPQAAAPFLQVARPSAPTLAAWPWHLARV